MVVAVFAAGIAAASWNAASKSNEIARDSNAIAHRAEDAANAHQVCSYSGVSIDVIYQNFPLPSYFGPREDRRAIANAQQAYPNCTFTGS